MKAGWETATIGSVCKVVAGQSPPGTAYNDQSVGLPFYQGKKEFGVREIAPPSVWTTVTTKVAEQGDILMSVRAPVGPVNFARERACIGRGLAAIRASGRIDPDFLFYNLWMRQSDIGGKEGAVFASINRTDIESIEIPLPPLKEQRRIVAVLDEAFAAIATATANAKKNLANARELLGRLSSSVFDGDDFRIGELLELQRGFDITKRDQRGGSVPVVSSSGTKSFHAVAMVKGPGVVIGRKGTLGSAFYVKEDYWPHDTTLWVKDFRGHNPKLIYYLFSHLDVKKLDSGTANPSLNRNLVHDLKVGWPEISDQRAVVTKLDKMAEASEKIQEVTKRKVDLLAALKQSLLHRAFTGELTATMPETIAA